MRMGSKHHRVFCYKSEVTRMFGLLVALIGQFGTVTVLGAGFTQAMRQLGMFILSSALMPLAHGVKQSVGKFMKGSEEFVDRKF